MDWDTITYCTPNCAGQGGTRPVAWSIGGEVAPTSCCGDDADEFNMTRKCNSWCTTDTADDACCSINTDCVNNSVCYASTECIQDDAYCDVGTWHDSDEAQTYCNTCLGASNWNLNGEVAPTACCGDDNGEYKTTCAAVAPDAFCSIGAALAEACCDTVSDCVYNDACYAKNLIVSGRNCTNGVWTDNVGPNVGVSGAPPAWVNYNVWATVTCNDLANSCDIPSYKMNIVTSDPGGGTPCSTDYDTYPIFAGSQSISSHSWICAAAKDKVGNPGFSPSYSEFKVDKNSPSTALNSPGAGSWQGANFNVNLADSDDAGGSGVNAFRCTYRVLDNGGQTLGWIARDCSGSVTITVGPGANCATPGKDLCTVQTNVTDNAGNSRVSSFAFSIDPTSPSCSLGSITEVASLGYQHVSGFIIYYNNDSGGSFRVTVSASDGGSGSGINNVNFPDTVSSGGDDFDSPYEWKYDWISTSVFDKLVTATCYDNAGKWSTATFRVYNDDTPPSMGSISYPDDYWVQPSLQVNFGTIGDSESGINYTSARLERSNLTLFGGACVGEWSAWETIDTGPAISPPNTYYNDETIQNARCYRYRYIVYDNVMNLGTFTSSNISMVDRRPPDGPATTDEGAYSDDQRLVFFYSPSDAESGVNNCEMQIDDASDFAPPVVFQNWVGAGPSYTWASGVNGNTYYARTRCRDNAGNIGSYGAKFSDGITVDMQGPVVIVVNDVRGSGNSADVQTVSTTDEAWVYFETSAGATGVQSATISLMEWNMATGSRSTIGNAVIYSPAQSQFAMFVFPDNMTKQLENERFYYFNVTANDSLGRRLYNWSNGFVTSPCEGQPCGKSCQVAAGQGVCNGLDVCYPGGGCNLTCSPPALAGTRVCYDNNNDIVGCGKFASDPWTYCGRTGATKCGVRSLCLDSVTNGMCLIDAAGNPVDVSGGWTSITFPDSGQYYGPSKPFSLMVSGISLVGGVPVQFMPLLTCTAETPSGIYYFDRWGRNDASLSFNPVTDGEWNFTRCSLVSDYQENGGWNIATTGTVKYPVRVDATKPLAVVIGPAVPKVGVKFNVTWAGTDPTVNGVRSGISCYDLQYVDTVNYGSGTWEATVNCISGGKYLIDLTGKPSGANYCYRIRAHDNANNVGDWTCEPGAGGDFSSCNCSTLDTGTPAGLWIITIPRYSNGNPVALISEWGAAAAAGGSTGSMSSAGFGTLDTPAGTKCFEFNYRVLSKTGAILKDWTPIESINDMKNVPVWFGGASYGAVNCTTNDTIIFRPGLFVDTNGDGIFEDEENREYRFRMRAISDVDGFAANSSWTEAAEGSLVDRTVPSVDVNATGSIEGLITSGRDILNSQTVTVTVTGDPLNTDFSGANESWFTYRQVSAAGTVIEQTINCGAEQKVCSALIGPWLDGDYNITFQGWSRDRATNLGTSSVSMFSVRGPIGVVSSVRDLFLVLGSYEYVSLQVSNRQNIDEEISISLGGDYMYSKFSDLEEGVLSTDKRVLNVTLLPLESKSVNIIVYTGDVCENCRMEVFAKSIMRPDINGTLNINVNVVFPTEFPELSWPSAFLLLCAAAALYAIVGRPEGVAHRAGKS